MTKKHFETLIEVLAIQQADCAMFSEANARKGDLAGKAFQAGASMALQRAIEYAKDAQAGILTSEKARKG